MNIAQFCVFAALLSVSSAVTKPWPGPYANHILGQVVEDTPEVAFAKRHHATAYSQVRAILPELPLEEKFPNAHAPENGPQHAVGIPQHVYQPVVTVKPQFTQFADEISRSPIGQTLEVEAARRAHFMAVMEREALLQELNAAERSTVASPVRPAFVTNNFPVDTSEVAAAKLEHARAVAAVLGL